MPSAMSACAIRPIPAVICLSRSRSPLLIEPDDILEYTLDSEPVRPPKVHLYAERVIHGCIYQARRDVMAVCHHHAPAVMPFAIAGKPIVPVFHLGAAMGEDVPFWDQHDEFGDTNLLVVKQEEGQFARARARAAFGGDDEPPRRDRGRRRLEGAGVALDLHVPERRISAARARARHAAAACIRGEVKLAGALSLLPNVVTRTWEYWSMRLEAAGAMPPRRVKRESGAPAGAETVPGHAARAAQGQAALRFSAPNRQSGRAPRR